MTEIGVALLGLGNVGSGCFRILEQHGDDIAQRLGARVVVRHALIRDRAKRRDAPFATADVERVLSDTGVQVVVEVMGGLEPAREYLLRAIALKKHVVTANKALLAEHGEELFARAVDAGVDLHFEGAVCGGIPIIRTMRESLASDRIEALAGIVNGTTNFILSRMASGEAGYAQALAEAQAKGYAEADPTLDVSGADAAQKLCLLARLAFQARLSVGQVAVEGITGLSPLDFAVARDFGYAVKLLALARKEGDALDVRVHPAFLPRASALAEVRGAFNAVLVQSAALGPSLYSGQGAGAMPTGSAVVSDIIDVARNILAGVSGRLPMLCAPYLREVRVRPASERVGPAYLRFTVADAPGVLGRIASVLGEHGVSIASLVQRQPIGGEPSATITIFTHAAREADVRAALARIDTLRDTTRATTQMIRIEPGLPL